jgi:hypothetical protein
MIRIVLHDKDDVLPTFHTHDLNSLGGLSFLGESSLWLLTINPSLSNWYALITRLVAEPGRRWAISTRPRRVGRRV